MQLINNCSDCSIRTFISCKFDDNLSGLIMYQAASSTQRVIEAKPTKEELLEAFDAIETEFNDLCGVFPEELSQTNKVNALIARNKAVELCFFAIDECLRRANTACLDALPRLRKHGVSIKWNNDIEDFKKQVANAKIINIGKEVELDDLTKGLETLQNRSVKSPQFTKKNFYQLILGVESVLGAKVPEVETNLYKFGVMCAEFYRLTKQQLGS